MTIKEKFFTKHEKEHSERYHKTINILNSQGGGI